MNSFFPFPLNWSIGEPIDCYGEAEHRSRVRVINVYGFQRSNLCIKIMKNTPENVATILKEARNNLIVGGMYFTSQFYGIYQLPDGQIGLVMQRAFIDGDLLMHRCDYNVYYCKDIYRLTSAQIFYQVALFLANLHARGLLHLDIKLGNIVLLQASGDFIYSGVIDFESLSKIENKEKNYTTTDCYCSPEHCKRLPATDKDDVWAYGMMLMVYYTGFNPFSPNNDHSVYYKKVTSKKFFVRKSKQFKNLPNDLQVLILSCLRQDPTMRPTMRQIVDDKFFADQGLTPNYIYTSINNMCCGNNRYAQMQV